MSAGKTVTVIYKLFHHIIQYENNSENYDVKSNNQRIREPPFGLSFLSILSGYAFRLSVLAIFPGYPLCLSFLGMLGVCLWCAWCAPRVLGVCLACAWGVPGVCLGCAWRAWRVPGVCLACAWGAPGVCLGCAGVCLGWLLGALRRDFGS